MWVQASCLPLGNMRKLDVSFLCLVAYSTEKYKIQTRLFVHYRTIIVWINVVNFIQIIYKEIEIVVCCVNYGSYNRWWSVLTLWTLTLLRAISKHAEYRYSVWFPSQKISHLFTLSIKECPYILFLEHFMKLYLFRTNVLTYQLMVISYSRETHSQTHINVHITHKQ